MATVELEDFEFVGLHHLQDDELVDFQYYPRTRRWIAQFPCPRHPDQPTHSFEPYPDPESDAGSSHHCIYTFSRRPQLGYLNPRSLRRPAISQCLGSKSSDKTCPRRLINVHTLKLVDFGYDDSIPHYAILSHRWGTDEVGYQEFSYPRRETKWKSGYRKILEACEQTRFDNLDYLWVDTCCIDQENQGDVHRNIKSMFLYYRNARVCYAYLADLCWETNFEGSDWFSRGWTLQELLAPPEILFFDQYWLYIGTRTDRSKSIKAGTGIAENVIRGDTDIQDVDFLERISWSAKRTTSRPQDQAYCLFGILGVSLEPDYNEDVETAFARLRDACFKKYQDADKLVPPEGKHTDKPVPPEGKPKRRIFFDI